MRAGWIRIITLSSLVIWAVQNKNYLNSSWKMNGNLKTPHLDHPCYFKGCCQSVYCNFLFLTPAALPDTSLFSCDEDNFFLQVSPFFPFFTSYWSVFKDHNLLWRNPCAHSNICCCLSLEITIICRYYYSEGTPSCCSSPQLSNSYLRSLFLRYCANQLLALLFITSFLSILL